MNLIKITSGLVLVLAIFSAGCKKEEIPGPKGEPGTPGGGGNANISSTNTFVVRASDWKEDAASGALKVSVNFTELTKDVIDKGTVTVYIQNGTSWFELPYDQGDLLMQYGFQEGILSLYYINIEGGFASSPGTATYRMALVRPSARPSTQRSALENDKVKTDRDLINQPAVK